MKYLLARLGYIALLLSMTAMLLEVGLQVLFRISPDLVFFNSAHYNRFRGKPFAADWGFNLNSQGFKDAEFSPQKKPGTFRVLGIGDSFVFGVVPYENNFLTTLEKEVNVTASANNLPAIELINMGIPGTDPPQYLEFLEDEALALKPNAILLHLFIGNDFELTNVKSARFRSQIKSVLKFIRAALTQSEGNVYHQGGQYLDDTNTFDLQNFIKIETHRSRFLYHPHHPELDKHLQSMLWHLKEFKRLCDDNSVKLLVVIIPDEVQVNRRLQEQVSKSAGWNWKELDFALPNKLLRPELERLGIDYVDMLQPFAQKTKKIRSSGSLYRKQDTHWNILGNDFAAELLLEPLTKLIEDKSTQDPQ